MALYCVGDIQGCDDAFERLLSAIGFSPSRDTVYLLGDLVNRGPGSATVLRRCMQLGDSARTVLGNHDLHLLATAHGVRKPSRRDTLQGVLQASDRDALLDWVRHQPLARRVEHGGQSLLMVHAGVLPQWTVDKTMQLAAEVEAVLRGADWRSFMRQMYGNLPDQWDDGLQGAARLRVIVNALTRLRFCSAEGRIDFDTKTFAPDSAPPGFMPWFEVPGRRTAQDVVAFGHWSTLGWLDRPDLISLDTGCVWGGALSAARIGADAWQRELIQVRCEQAQAPGGVA